MALDIKLLDIIACPVCKGKLHYEPQSDKAAHELICRFDRLAYPLEELFRLSASIQGWVVYYLPVMTVLGLSGLWEIIESWVARAVHPELGVTYLGSQGDIWDAQKDMAAALYGSLLCMTLLLVVRALRGAESALESEAALSE